MALEQRLEVKMLQKLVLTPQLQQAIKLLQLPQLELSQVINNELVENPLLEEAEEEAGEGEKPGEEGAEEAGEEDFSASDDIESPLEKLMGFGAEEYFDNRSYDGRDLGYFNPDSNPVQSPEHYVSEGTDLYDHLDWQLRFADVESDVKSAAEVVIGNMDDNGYLQASLEDIAQYAGVGLETAGKAIAIVQTFDPAGVGARDLMECLLLQLGPLKLKGTLVENLIRNNLRDMEKRRYQHLAVQYGHTLEEIKGAVHIIEGLEPKPGRGISSLQPIYIKPDVFLVRDDDDFRIILNDENIPSLRLNSYYRSLLANKGDLQREEKEYLTERMRSAIWLLKSLDHRNRTIYRVTESILNFQRGFFERGVAEMKPLNLKDVARDLDMHESTISRATSNKYLSCSHGLFNFRFFFSSGVKGDFGTVSSTSIKEMMNRIIREENPERPLSDQEVAGMLRKFNMKVARRTVAKYRDELNIASQNLRKKE